MTTSNYTSVVVYLREGPADAFTHTMHKDKEAALDVVRALKDKHGEPRMDFVENTEADVLHFRFKGTSLIGRVVFMKRELCERIHCPWCGNILRRKEGEPASCHDWRGDWVFDGVNGIWRVQLLTREAQP